MYYPTYDIKNMIITRPQWDDSVFNNEEYAPEPQISHTNKTDLRDGNYKYKKNKSRLLRKKGRKEMEITFNQCQRVLDKLPISLYLGKGVSVKLIEDNSGEEAWIDVFAKEITLNFTKLKEKFIPMKDIDDVEKYIRADLYHEISHAISTPSNLYNYHISTPYSDRKITSALNIFEDERIETIHATYYYGVDFPEANIIMNDYHGQDATNAREDFYFTIRFKHGKKEFIQRTTDIINATPLSVYNFNTDGYYDGEEYKESIIKLMEDIYRDWYEENEKEKLLDKNPNYDSLSTPGKNEIVSELEKEEHGGDGDNPQTVVYIGETEFNNLIKQMQQAEKNNKPEKGDGPKVQIVVDASMQEAIDKKEEWLETYTEHVDETKKRAETQKMLQTYLNKFTNADLIKAIDEIFAEFDKKTKNNSTATQRYSGRFNPREVGRKDWRVWTYKDETGAVKGSDKLHMNLFIDTSGSFRHNQDKVNTLLRSLIDLERKYKFFCFDLVTCQIGETLRTKEERYIECGGGNDIDNEIWDIYKKLQDPRSFNVNIALFDGCALTDARGHDHAKNFGVFNSNHNSIISDTDNKAYIEKYSPNSHNTMVPRSGSDTYPDLLFENIINSINKVLR